MVTFAQEKARFRYRHSLGTPKDVGLVDLGSTTAMP